jgi:hypothetical protein
MMLENLIDLSLGRLLSGLAWLAGPAWQPFHEPLRIGRYWIVLLVPMVVAIAVVYKTIKVEDLSQLPRQAATLSMHIIVFMVLAAATLWLVTELF